MQSTAARRPELEAGRRCARLLVLVALLVSAPGWGQGPVDQAMGLIVKIEAEFDEGTPSVGAGIAFAFDGDRLYVATANHVVRRSLFDEATAIRVSLHGSQDAYSAELLEHAERDLDLATLVVALSGEAARPAFAFDRLGAADGLERGDEVWHIGHGGRDWRLNVEGDPVSTHKGSRFFFESSGVDEGHSGGGVFNADLELVGMVIRTSAAEGQAIEIETVVEYLEDWGLPVDLSRPELAVCEIPRIAGKVPKGAWNPYDRGLKEARKQYPDWAMVARDMTRAIERHPTERGFNKRGLVAGRFHYLPYYYLGLALYKEADGCEGWSCAWDISLELGEALETEEGKALEAYRQQCKPTT